MSSMKSGKGVTCTVISSFFQFPIFQFSSFLAWIRSAAVYVQTFVTWPCSIGQ